MLLMFRGYTGPKTCDDEGVTYCPGVIPGVNGRILQDINMV